MTEDCREGDGVSDRAAVSRRRLLAGAGVGLAGGLTGTLGTATASMRAAAADVPPIPAHPLDASPGSQFAPHDGFATIQWFDDSVDVYTVTNLDSTGTGSLRWAVEQTGPRLVVFEVSGTIDLGEDRLEIPNDQCWIAGQTAPSPGITLIRGDVRVDANDCVVQHLRVRPGDAGNDAGWEPDGLRTSDGTANNVVDHCSVSWSVDENVSPGYNAADTTYSNCIVAEPLHDSSHSKGPHGYGMLVGDGSTGNVVVGNLFAHNVRRNVRLKVDTEAVVANNVFYDFEEGTNMDEAGSYAIEGNGYVRTVDDKLIQGGAKNGNQPEGYLADNWATVDAQLTNGQIDLLDSRPRWPTGLSTVHPGEVTSHDAVHAGARPADRTSHDRRPVDDVRNGTGSVVDSQSEVGGYPTLAENVRSLSVPDSNLGDWLYEFTREVERDVTDYATDGVVTGRQVRSAVTDWRDDVIDATLLRRVVDAW